jgi:hypothetical protein
MKKTLRLLVVATAGAVGLAFSASALASYNPSLTVEQSSYRLGAATTIDFFILAPRDDDPTAKISIFSPGGYAANLTHAPGTTLGKAFARVKAGSLGGAELTLSGDLVVGDPTNTTLGDAAFACTGTRTHKEIWVLNTTLSGQSIQVPAFVDQAGPYVQQQICLPHPQNATFQAQLIAAEYNVAGVFTNASAAASYQWAGDFTPYASTVPNPAGTVEWRTQVGLPSSLTLKRVKSKPGVVKFTGKLSIKGLDPSGVWLYLYAGLKVRPAPNATLLGTGKRVAKSAKLKASGKFAFTRRKVKKKTYFQARFENLFKTSCTGPSPTGLPIPCKGTDLAPITSNQVKVLPPRRRHR